MAQEKLRFVSDSDVEDVRSNCLQFYEKAATEVRKKLPYNDVFLSNLTVFAKKNRIIRSKQKILVYPRKEHMPHIKPY